LLTPIKSQMRNPLANVPKVRHGTRTCFLLRARVLRVLPSR
jgi:hypothetical protein